jgi:hypothetical protein
VLISRKPLAVHYAYIFLKMSSEEIFGSKILTSQIVIPIIGDDA